jgi:sugar lactone lactonase YvrE
MPGKITVYDPKGKQIREWGGVGKKSGEFQQPGGIAIGLKGLIYIADQVNRRVQVFTPEGKFARMWGEYGVGHGQFGGNENPASRTGGPNFVAIDRKGAVYTTEASVGRIQKFTPEGKYLHSWGSNGAERGGFGGRPRNLPGPICIALDHSGRVWVSSTNHRVQQFTPEGKFLQLLGDHGTAPRQFETPHGLAFDSKGCLYVCDTQNARIQKFSLFREESDTPAPPPNGEQENGDRIGI